jgi:hypothetical protein
MNSVLPTNPPKNASGWTRFQTLWPLLPLCLLLFLHVRMAGWPIERVGRAIEYPYQLDAEEGFLLAQALRFEAGEGLYRSLTEPPYAVDNYPPLYPVLWSLFVSPDAPSLEAGRWITALSAGAALLGMALLILGQGRAGAWVRAVWRRRFSPEAPSSGFEDAPSFWGATQTLLIALLCPAMFAVTYAFQRWAAYARVDFLSIALSVWGLVVFALRGTRPEGRLARWLAILFFTLALLTKQTSLAAPAACTIWLFVRDRRQGIRFFLTLALAVGGTTVLLCVLTAGRYWMHTVTYNRNVMHWNELLLWARHFYQCYALLLLVLVILGGWALVGVWRAFRSRTAPSEDVSSDPDLTLFLLYATLNVASLVTLAKAGAAENYLLEPHLAAALFLGVALDALLGRLHAPDRKRLGATTVAVCVLVLLVGNGWWYAPWARLFHFSAPSPLLSGLTQGARVEQAILQRPRPVLSEDPIYHLRLGRPVLFQNFIMTQLAGEGKWDESPLVRRVEAREIALVVSHQKLEDADQFFNRYSPALRQAIVENYRLLETLPRPNAPQEPYPPLQTIYIYEPRLSADDADLRR